MTYTLPTGTTAVPGQKILSARYNAAMNSIAAALNARRESTEIQPGAYGGTGVDATDKSGSVIFYNGVGTIANQCLSVESFGASPSATAAANTAAFNDAIAESGGTIPVLVPAGTWDLNALTKTIPFHLFGAGRATVLRFNTTGVGIECEDLTPDQGQTFHVHDLAFSTTGNVPAAIILNRYPVNSRFERLYFSTLSATYCIDNESGYGTKISDCVFSDVTGSGVRLRQNVEESDYSFAASVQDCDFTRLSQYGIFVEGAMALTIIGGVLQSCGVAAIRLDCALNTRAAWGVNLHGVYFEGNPWDIYCTDTQEFYAVVTEVGVYHGGPTPALNMGDYGRLVIVGNQSAGGALAGVCGGDESRVFILAGVSHNYIKNTGTYLGVGPFTGQWYDLGQYYDAVSTPTWESTGTQPVLAPGEGGAGTLTSHWTRNGSIATVTMHLKMGASTTFGTGRYIFRDALLTLLPCTDPTEAVGMAMMYDDSGACRVGACYMDPDTYGQAIAVTFDGVGEAGFLGATNPWTWAAGDWIRLTMTYRCTAS